MICFFCHNIIGYPHLNPISIQILGKDVYFHFNCYYKYENMKKDKIKRNLEIISLCRKKIKSKKYGVRTLTFHKFFIRLKYSVYRLYKTYDLSPDWISAITGIKKQYIQNYIGSVFKEQCIKNQCIFSEVLNNVSENS